MTCADSSAAAALDVEVDCNGKVVAVWFRCCALPFEQHDVDVERAKEMRLMSANLNFELELHGVELKDPHETKNADL
ncbi:MAG: hypothetical protein ACREA9_28950 [Pyrinomonadaceae bacterium]